MRHTGHAALFIKPCGKKKKKKKMEQLHRFQSIFTFLFNQKGSRADSDQADAAAVFIK